MPMLRTLSALTLSLALAACSRSAKQEEPTTSRVETTASVQTPGTLSVDEVEALLGKPGVYLFDGNLELYGSLGHLPGARLAHFDDITKEALPSDRNATLIFYCKNTRCQTAEMSAERALALGYSHVFRMPAGIDGWVKAGKPIVRG